MKKLFIAATASALLAGCATSPNQNEIVIDGQAYQKDSNGVLHLSKNELKLLAGKPDMKFVEGEIPQAKITETEFELVKEDEEAFFSLVGQASPEEDVAMLVKPGSLKANLERVISENKWSALHYDGPDMFISTPSILNSANVPMATMSLIGDYDLYPCIDEENKVVTIIKDE